MRRHVSPLFALAILASGPVALGQGYAPSPVFVSPASPSVSARTNVVVPAPTTPTTPPAPAVSTATSLRANAPTPPPPSRFANPTPSAPMLPPAQIGASPPSLSFDSIWNGDPPARKFFTIDRVPRGGQVTVTMGGTAPFHIAEMLVYGLPPKGSPMATATLPLAQGGGGSQNRPPRPSPYANQVLKATVASAPFSAVAADGDRVVVAIDFAPKWSLDEVAGPKSARVDVAGFQWKSQVPLAGFFNGLKLGLAVARPPTFYAADQPYVPGNRFSAYSPTPQLSIVNATGQPQLVQLTADQLPPGVVVAPQQVQFAAGDSRSIPLSVTWDPRSNPTGDARLRLAFGASTSFATMHVEHVPFGRTFRATGSGWIAEVVVSSGGEVRYNAQCYISGMQFVHDCTFYFYCNGQTETNTVSHAATVGGPANDVKSWVNHTGLKPDEVFDRMQANWAVVEFDSHSGNPDDYARTPLAPQP
jgi:hypothetical protein